MSRPGNEAAKQGMGMRQESQPGMRVGCMQCTCATTNLLSASTATLPAEARPASVPRGAVYRQP